MDSPAIDRLAREGERLLRGTPPGGRPLARLLEEVRGFLLRFVVLTPHQANILTLWIAHTHAIGAAVATLFLAITSPEKQSGKTRLLEVLELLVRRAWRAVFPSEAVLYRKIEKYSPTLLLDEVDAVFGKKTATEHEALRSLLNAGNRRGATVDRCVGKGGEIRLEQFSVFGARALAGIGALPDTIADRSIPIRMKRRMRDEKLARFRSREVEPEALDIRGQLEGWASGVLDLLRDSRPVVPEALSDRMADGAEPLLAIADLAGAEWPEWARQGLVALCSGEAVEDESIGVRLLGDCLVVFNARDVERLHSIDLCTALREIEESPWSEWRRGEPISPNSLARLLKGFGIRSSQVWVDAKNRHGYERSSFEESWRRWLPVSAATSLETAYETLETLEPNKDGPFVSVSETLGDPLPSGSESEESSIKTGTLASLAFETPPGETWRASAEALADASERLSPRGPGWAVVSSENGDGDMLLLRDRTVSPPTSVMHLRRFIVADLAQLRVD